MGGQRGSMRKLLAPLGLLLMAASFLAAGAAVIAGSLQWLGVMAHASDTLPPQSLVVGGLFLGTPLAALGWGLMWFGRWLRDNG